MTRLRLWWNTRKLRQQKQREREAFVSAALSEHGAVAWWLSLRDADARSPRND